MSAAAATVGSAGKGKKKAHNFPVNEKVRRYNVMQDEPSAIEANCARHIRINPEEKQEKHLSAVKGGAAVQVFNNVQEAVVGGSSINVQNSY